MSMASGDGGLDWLGVDGVVVEAMIMGEIFLGFEQRPSEVDLRCYVQADDGVSSWVAWVPGGFLSSSVCLSRRRMSAI